MTPPASFICPITKELMADPVQAPSGMNFEREAILAWLGNGKTYCPITEFPLDAASLRTNPSLQWKIKYWQWKQNGADAEPSNFTEPEVTRAEGPTPVRFLCALTQKVMRHPVMTKHGHGYERDALFQWLEKRGPICPVTGMTMKYCDIITDHRVAKDIERWERKQQQEGISTVGTEKSGNFSVALDSPKTQAPSQSQKQIAIAPQGSTPSGKELHPKYEHTIVRSGNPLKRFFSGRKMGTAGAYKLTDVNEDAGDSLLSVLHDVEATLLQ